MIKESEIKDIIKPIIKIRKDTLGKLKSPDKPLSYYPGYADFCGWRESITNHTVKGKKPMKLLSARAPYQSQEELDYCLVNFKQITLPVSFEFQTTIARGLHDSNWSIQYGEENKLYVDGEMTFKKYLEEDIAETPLQMSYDSWMKFVLSNVKISDSMGVVAFRPHTQEKTVVVEGEEVIAGDALPEPIPYYYSCERVMTPSTVNYVLIETPRLSMVEKAGRKVREGLIYELYDDENVWFIEQVGKLSDYEFKPQLYFKHSLGFIPVTYLKGIPDPFTVQGEINWQSPFLMVSDILDDVLIDGTMLRSVKASCAYPQKAMIGNNCQFRDPKTNNPCKGGYVLSEDNSSFYKCPECDGSGMGPRTSPLKTLYVKPKNSLDEGDSIRPVDAIAYISPSDTMPKLLRDEITQGIMNAMSILHLKTTNSVVQGAEDFTATGMALDEKAKYAFIKSVVDQIFDIYEFGMKCMGGMRYGDDFVMPFIQRPISYDFNSEGDYLLQITAAQTAGAPPVVIASYIYKYLQAIFYDNPRTAKSYDLIIAADRLFIMTKEQIMSEIARNLIQPWEVVLHDSALTFIADLVREDDQFLDQEMDIMIEALRTKAKENTPATSTPSVRLSPLNILENANNPEAVRTDSIIENKNIVEPGQDDLLGELSLALQRIALARQRAVEAGDKALASQLGTKMKELTKEL